MARKMNGLILLASAVLLAAPILAADPPKMTPEQQKEMDAYKKAGTPGPEHKHMAEMAGSYDAKIKMWHDAKSPVEEETGTVKRTMMLDGRVMTEDMTSQMMGMPYMGHGMMGYDNTTKKWWSTWSDNMGTGIMMTTGTCDANHACTFHAGMMDPVTNKMVKYRMTTKWTSPTTEVFEMHAPGKDGKEMKMMEITYTKK
jgi:hypothetical protein